MHGGIAIRKTIELDDLDEYRILAGALAMGGSRFGEAQTDYFALLERNPDNAYYFYWFGMSLLAENNCDGREAVSRALLVKPSWGEAHLVLARADVFCGDLSEATRRMQAIRAKNNDLEVRLAEAYVSVFLGDATRVRQMAEPELPHPEAQLVMNALDADANPNQVFAVESPWWIPLELN